MFQLITESPSWLIVFCILAGVLLSWLLYRRDTLLKGVNPWLRRFMMTLRFIAITLLAFLLLTPLIRTLTRQTEKPIIIVAQDNSQSIATNQDSTSYRLTYPATMEKLISELQKKYEVKTLSFGDAVSERLDFSFSAKQTDFSSLLDEVDVRYANRNVGAIVIASDGLYNNGSNPLYHSVKAPVYTVALGDTNAQKDIIAGSIQYNKTAYLNNSFPIEITVLAREANGGSTTLTVTEDSAVVFSRALTVAGNKFRQVVPVHIDAKKKGVHHYKISLTPISGEITTTNNSKDIYVEVMESKRKILIVADSPHPDIAALKLAIESNENYEVVIGSADRPADLNDIQLIILHQLPSNDHPASELIRSVRDKQVPCWYILGSQSNVNAFNQLESGVTIRNSLNRTSELKPAVNADFMLFTLEDRLASDVKNFSPLIAPFGEYIVSGQGASLLTQQIGSVLTKQPLLFLGETNSGKTGILSGEGLWRWKLNDYQLNKNFDVFNSIVSKTVQYLSTREVKTHFKLLTKNSFNENEPVVMDAEVYNDNFELINTPDVSITITNSEKKSFPFTFSKTDKAYTLNAGLFSPGDYHYSARVKAGEKLYTSEGSFSVNALQVEQNETVADHQLLYSLSEKTGGKLFYPSQLNDLASLLVSKEDIKTVSYSQIKLVDLVNLKSIFFVLLALLSLEWFLRKRSGGY